MNIVIHPPEKASSTTQYVNLIGKDEDDCTLLRELSTHRDYCMGFKIEQGLIFEVQLKLRRMNEPRLIAEAERMVGCKVTKQEPPAITRTPPTPVDSAATIPPPA